MLLVKKSPFLQLFFFRNKNKQNVFYDILERKNAFQAIKTGSLNSRKIDIFLKGFTHAFGKKIAIFPTFFFLAIQARKMLFTLFQNEKTLFQAIIRPSSKSRKIDIFPTGLTHGFGPKMTILQLFFLRQYWPGKCVIRYSRTKKRLSRL